MSLIGRHCFSIRSYLAFWWWTDSFTPVIPQVPLHTALLSTSAPLSRRKDREGMFICIICLLLLFAFLARAIFIAHSMLFFTFHTLIRFSSCFLLPIHLAPPLCWVKWKSMNESDSSFQSHIGQWGLKWSKMRSLIFCLSNSRKQHFFSLVAIKRALSDVFQLLLFSWNPV